MHSKVHPAAAARDFVDRDSVFTNYKSVFSRQFGVSLLVEFIGTMLFWFIASTAVKALAPFVAGFALAVWIYTAASISGGHLNPAVTFSVFLCGFFPLAHTLLYIFLQVAGAICGSLLAAALVPGVSVGMGSGAPGCFDRGGSIHPGLTNAQLFFWEAIMTFTLISAVYACGVAKPGHGSHTPWVVGLALFVCAGSGGRFTGAALNPAVVLAPWIVFGCGTGGLVLIYILAHLLAALVACAIFAIVSGLGPLNVWSRALREDLTFRERVQMWMMGSPPGRLRQQGQHNVRDVLLHSKGAYGYEEDQSRAVAAQEQGGAHAHAAPRAAHLGAGQGHGVMER